MRALCVVLAVSACGRIGFEDRFGSLEIVVTSHEPGPSTPVVNAAVWSTTTAGALVDVQRTDANGRAILQIERGGTVSAYDADLLWVSTFVGVELDDDLVVGLPTQGSESQCLGPQAGTVRIDFDPVAEPASYRVTKNCYSVIVGPGATGMDFPLITQGAEPADLLLRAYDLNDELIATATKRSVPFHDGVMHRFTAGEWQSGVPASLGFTRLEGVAAGSMGHLIARLYAAGGVIPHSPDAGSIETSPQPIANDTLMMRKAIPVDASRVTLLGFVEHDSLPGANVMTLLARPFVPIGMEVTGTVPSVPMSAAWEPERRQLSWTFASEGRADAVDAMLVFGTGEGDSPVWTLRMPPDTTRAVLPAVPAELELPHSSMSQVRAYLVISNDYLDAADYNAARRLGDGTMSTLVALELALPASHSGAFSVLSYPEIPILPSTPSNNLRGAERDLRWLVHDLLHPAAR